MAEIALECRPLEVLADERLATLAAQGDDRAFAVLYVRYQAPLRRYCGAVLRANGADADDVVQTTMARALASLHTRRDGGLWRAWLFRIARNESLEVLRRRRPTADLSAVEYVGPWSVEATLEQRERLRRLLEDLDDLPERQRSALVLRAMNGLEPQEIGDALAMSAAAARQAIHEARSALADFEHGRDMACEQVRFAVETGDGRRLRERRLRAHLRACAGCRDFRDTTRAARRRRAFLPSLGFLSGLAQRLQAAGVPEGMAPVKAVAAAAVLAITAGLAAQAPRIVRHESRPPAATASPSPAPTERVRRAAAIAARAPALTAAPATAPAAGPAPAHRPEAGPGRKAKPPVAPRPSPPLTATPPPPAPQSDASTWTNTPSADPLGGPASGRPGATTGPGGLSKKDGGTLPPGQAKKQDAGTPPPGQGAASTTPLTPEQIASLPPGQAKKVEDGGTVGSLPPGQAKKIDGPSTPPGQAKKAAGWQPPGQAEKADAAAPVPGDTAAAAVPADLPSGQAKKEDDGALSAGQAKKDDAEQPPPPDGATAGVAGPPPKDAKPPKPAKSHKPS